MIEHRHVAVGVACFGILTIALTVLLWRWCCQRSSEKNKAMMKINGELVMTRTDSMNERLQSGIAKLHQDRRRIAGNYFKVRRGVSGRPLFIWSDHPALITDAVEHGWSRFAFASSSISLSLSSPSPTASARLFGMCAAAAGNLRRDSEPEMSWEICQDSSDFMQKIRLNNSASNNNNNSSTDTNNNNSGLSVIRTALPLPGPAIGRFNGPFPQEAYFEITVLNFLAGEKMEEDAEKVRECERTKLIQESNSDKRAANSESLVHFVGNGAKVLDDSKLSGRDDEKGGRGATLSVGLTAGGSLPLKPPGSYPGSIGFNTDGSVFVDGTKLVFASEKGEWGRADKVIGCGFDPKQKKVFFTVDSEVIHVVNCKSEEFSTPLYPTLAANSDVLVLVNLGQSAFKYAPANTFRTPNPCFVGPAGYSPAGTIGSEDSKELFSMGRIDSQWLNRGGAVTRGSQVSPGNHNPNRALDYDEDSEADLFEIVLDSCGRSPNLVT